MYYLLHINITFNVILKILNNMYQILTFNIKLYSINISMKYKMLKNVFLRNTFPLNYALQLFSNTYLEMFVVLREKYRCERKTQISCFSYAPQPGIEPTTVSCMEQCLSQMSHPAGAA